MANSTAWVTVASLVSDGVIGIGCSYVQYRKAVRELSDDSGSVYLYNAERKNLIKPNYATVII